MHPDFDTTNYNSKEVSYCSEKCFLVVRFTVILCGSIVSSTTHELLCNYCSSNIQKGLTPCQRTVWSKLHQQVNGDVKCVHVSDRYTSWLPWSIVSAGHLRISCFKMTSTVSWSWKSCRRKEKKWLVVTRMLKQRWQLPPQICSGFCDWLQVLF